MRPYHPGTINLLTDRPSRKSCEFEQMRRFVCSGQSRADISAVCYRTKAETV